MYFTKSTLSLVGSQLSVGHLQLISLKLNPVLFPLKTMKIWGLKQLSGYQNAESPLRKRLYGSVWHIAAPCLCEEPILTPNCQLEPVHPPPTVPSQLPIFSKRNQSGGRGALCGPNKRAKIVRTPLFKDGGAVAQTARLSGLCSNEPTGLCSSLATVTHGWGESWEGGGLWGQNVHRNWTFQTYR